MLVVGPGMHFAIGIASFFRELFPHFWLGQELRDGALRQAKDIFRKESLADVVCG